MSPHVGHGDRFYPTGGTALVPIIRATVVILRDRNISCRSKFRVDYQHSEAALPSADPLVLQPQSVRLMEIVLRQPLCVIAGHGLGHANWLVAALAFDRNPRGDLYAALDVDHSQDLYIGADV